MTTEAIKIQTEMTLAEQNSELLMSFMNQLPEEQQAIVQQEMGKIMSAGFGKDAIGVGDSAPDFSLIDTSGNDTRLYDILQKGPIVISFYRGGWCPFCSLEFKALMDIYPEVKSSGAEMIAISPQTHNNSVSTVQDQHIAFPVLSDPGNQVIKRFGLLFTVPEALRPLYEEWGIDVPKANGSDSYDLPIPATYIIGSDGKVKDAYVNVNYTERLEPIHILRTLGKINT